ncbi:Rossmann-like and DUF2520 domain-containing protein [Variovorax sp. LG9.2]|uniref:Rossmann-like and DUF2520 domain-containing protein n=1 Tax=Variovorax sp. LG9.2 TaxID=3048626 RepID=UPI002B233A07|nr:DUF2520 domain-containing protein [Variovorax sp. LG9.2]MEB0058437.1 DUF2520 domain-containing protein [Variovorax sp. LG9.2]
MPIRSIETVSIGFIGAGRLGKALAWSLATAGLAVRGVASSIEQEAVDLANRIEACEVMAAQAVVDRCDLVFITTPDSIIAQAVAPLRFRAGTGVIHCSGATEVDALASVQVQGAAIGGFHPMQTFADPDAAVASLPGSTITIEARDDELDRLLVQLVERLHCHVNRLPPGMRGRYHAAAGFTTQFINALFYESARVWKSWGAEEADAMRAMLPMAHGTLAAIESVGIARGMPGPVSRSDVVSVEKHVAALTDLGDDMAAFYRVLCGVTVRIARESGAVDADAAARFDAALTRGVPAAST